ncbi:MAG TPA: hypothetical protein VGY54_10820 [Polyangiaceae bacterium]|jgi:hypothetical protein|nr:hypothetical protein [Polyangiaceae bacterium]
MTTLAQHYPAALESAIHHAERLSQAFSMPELTARLDPWGVGRANEIARFVELVVSDWQNGLLSDEAAASELDAYVESLESGLCERLDAPGEGANPDTSVRGPTVAFSPH